MGNVGRKIRIGCILLLAAGSVVWLLPATAGADAPGQSQSSWRQSTGERDRPGTRRNCGKRKGVVKAKRRSCRRHRHPAPVIVGPVAEMPAAATPSAAATDPGVPAEETPEPDPPLPPKESPYKEGPPPLPSPTPRCDLVEGDCSIYSDKFWELLAKYKRFEIGTGVYPMPPGCMEAQEAGKPVSCIQVIVYLQPDGTLSG